jgi:hypothetical protein
MRVYPTRSKAQAAGNQGTVHDVITVYLLALNKIEVSFQVLRENITGIAVL